MRRRLVPPQWVGTPPTGNPGSATVYVLKNTGKLVVNTGKTQGIQSKPECGHPVLPVTVSCDSYGHCYRHWCCG